MSLLRGRSRRLVGCASAGLQRIEPLAAQPKRCYRCLMLGHATSCGSPDRGRRCFRCAGPHLASECRSWTLKCPLCADFGHPDSHVLGAKACPPPGRGSRAAPHGRSQGGQVVGDPSEGASKPEQCSRVGVGRPARLGCDRTSFVDVREIG